MLLKTLLLTIVLGGSPDTWPGFLGQGATVVDPETIPLTWSPTEHVVWTTKLPGKGQSSPVIWGDRVYVTAIDGTMKERCQVTALKLSDGTIAWNHTAKAAQTVRANYFQSRSAPTPVVDERAVYTFFETGNLLAFSHEGGLLWERKLTEDFGPFESTIGLASSPLLINDELVILIDHEGPSYLLAVDKLTGKTRWKTDRDSRVSYASPARVPVGKETHIVCSSAGSVDGYDPDSGRLLWSHSEEIGGNRSATPLPLGDGRFVIAASPGMHNENESEARRSNGVMTIKKSDDGFSAAIKWRTEEAMPAFNTPTVHHGFAYWVNRAGVVFCFDAETGVKQYAQRIKQGCWATPVGVGDRVYFFGKDGLTTVLKSGPEFEVLAENQLWDPEQSGVEWLARQRASGGKSVGHREHDSAEHKPADDVSKGKATAKSTESGNPRPSDAETPEKRGTGGRPATTPEDEKKLREQGENRFADPVQYGVALVNGSLVIRTGEVVYCIRNPASNP